MSKLITEKSFSKKDQKCVPDIYNDIDQVYDILHKLKFKNSNIIVGIDTSDLAFQYKQDYSDILNIIANTMKEFDDDGLIPSFLFNQHEVLNLKQIATGDDTCINCHGLDDVMRTFNEITPSSGPYGINKLFKEIKKILDSNSGEYYMLLLLTSGQNIKNVRTQIDNVQKKDKLSKEDKATLKELKKNKHEMKQKDTLLQSNIKSLCKYPLSIITIGINKDNDYFDKLNEMDNLVKGRKFDNFQFVNYHAMNVIDNSKTDLETKQFHNKFVLEMLREIPIQYSYMIEHKLLKH